MSNNFIWKTSFSLRPLWCGWQRQERKSHLVAGLVRRMGLPGCWCASSRSHRRDPAGSHTERSPHQTYSSLQRETQQDLNHLGAEMLTNWTNQFKFIWMQREFPSDGVQSNLGSVPVCRFFSAGLCRSSLTNHQESELQQSSLKASQDHLWLNHQGLQLIIWAHHQSLGTTMCELAACGPA